MLLNGTLEFLFGTLLCFPNLRLIHIYAQRLCTKITVVYSPYYLLFAQRPCIHVIFQQVGHRHQLKLNVPFWWSNHQISTFVYWPNGSKICAFSNTMYFRTRCIMLSDVKRFLGIHYFIEKDFFKVLPLNCLRRIIEICYQIVLPNFTEIIRVQIPLDAFNFLHIMHAYNTIW